GDMQTVDDRKLLYLVWVYDLYYPWTKQKIVEKGYLERVIATLPRDAEVEQAVERLKSFIST
ncbi:MAG: metal-dependent phosphohydrolase, partial [Phascolarctobacterium sp.]